MTKKEKEVHELLVERMMEVMKNAPTNGHVPIVSSRRLAGAINDDVEAIKDSMRIRDGREKKK